jgi:hypothetical protein
MLVAAFDNVVEAGTRGKVIAERRIEATVIRLFDSTLRVTRRGKRGDGERSEPQLHDKAMKEADRVD